MKTDLRTLQTSEWVQLTIAAQSPKDGFAPESFINAHMVTLPDTPAQLVVVMESLDDVGFDEISFVNVTSGVLSRYPQANLMEDSIIFMCSSSDQCDKNQVSAIDSVNNVLYMQANTMDQSTGETKIALYSYTYTCGKVGQCVWIANVNLDSTYYPTYGYSGYQFVTIK